MRGFPDGTVVPHLVGPEGDFIDMLRELGTPVETCRGMSQFDNCDYSYYRGWRWIILLREMFLLLPTYRVLMRARRKWGAFDIVHINDITMPFAAWVTKRFFPDSAVVIHARAVQRTAETCRKRWLQEFFRTHIDAIVAINENVSESLPDDLPVHVVYNGMAVPTDGGASIRGDDRPFSAAMVGVLTRAKGCVDFVKAAAICRDKGYPIRFLLVGGGLRAERNWLYKILQRLGFAEDVRAEIKALIEKLGLEDIVVFRSFTVDLASIYREVDVLCFPSHLDAPGRPIFEAGFFGVPSIAAISRPKEDTFVPGETGLLVGPGQPDELAKAIMRLHDSPEERKHMGDAARRLAVLRFDSSKTAENVLKLYRSLISAKRNPARKDHPE
jgi:glycosyltransferase involved in cell wall biosynthesis